jgi:spore coat protein CotH
MKSQGLRKRMLLVLLPVVVLTFTVLPRPTAHAQTADDLFDPSVLHEIRINVHPSDWRQLKERFEENTRYPADFRWFFQGQNISADQVSIRSRGAGSRSGVKPGLDVEFDRFTDRPFLGLRNLVLRNNAQDPSMLHERIAMAFTNLREYLHLAKLTPAYM